MAYSDHILIESSLQSYWKLDEASGATSVADSKGSVTGTASGITFGATGLITDESATASSQNGSTGSLSMGNVYSFVGVLPFSVEFWMRLDDVTAQQHVVAKEFNDGLSQRQGYDFVVSGGTIWFQRWVDGASIDTPTVAVSTATTYHCVATYDGTNSRLYVNAGAAQVSASDTRAIVANTANFGTGFSGGTFWSPNGTVDEIAVYNVALSAQQILNHYRAGTGANESPRQVGIGTPAWTATNAATFAPGLPTGWAANDIHVLVASRNDTTAMTALSGWTQIATLSGANGTHRSEVWWRRAVGGDAAPTVTMGSGTVVRGGAIIGIRGCPTSGDPFSTGSRSPNASSTTVATTSVTAPSVDSLGIFAFAFNDNPTSVSTQPVSPWSPFIDAVTLHRTALGNDQAVGFSTALFPASASYGTPSCITAGALANVNEGLLLPMLAPVAGGAAVTYRRLLLGVGT